MHRSGFSGLMAIAGSPGPRRLVLYVHRNPEQFMTRALPIFRYTSDAPDRKQLIPALMTGGDERGQGSLIQFHGGANNASMPQC